MRKSYITIAQICRDFSIGLKPLRFIIWQRYILYNTWKIYIQYLVFFCTPSLAANWSDIGFQSFWLFYRKNKTRIYDITPNKNTFPQFPDSFRFTLGGWKRKMDYNSPGLGHFFTKKGRLWEMKVGKIEQYDNMILDSSCIKNIFGSCEVCLLGPPGVGKTALVEEAWRCNDVGSWGINLGYWNWVWFNYGSCNLKVPTLKWW